MYMDHFGLDKPPFSIEPDPHFMVLSEDHQEALSTLIYAIEQQEGWALLMGRSGEGKTTLIMALLRELSNWVISAVITNPRLEPLDFYNLLAMEMGMEGPYASKGEFLVAFGHYLAECRREGKALLVVVDDAHAVQMDMLEELKLLGNQDDGSPRVLNIFLVAQLEFLDLLREAKPRGLLQRLRRYHKLRPLNGQETAAYVRHRLEIAGARHEIFPEDSLQVLHQVSGGNCRLINIVADEAMLLAYSQELDQVTPELVGQAAESNPEISLMAEIESDAAPVFDRELAEQMRTVQEPSRPARPRVESREGEYGSQGGQRPLPRFAPVPQSPGRPERVAAVLPASDPQGDAMRTAASAGSAQAAEFTAGSMALAAARMEPQIELDSDDWGVQDAMSAIRPPRLPEEADAFDYEDEDPDQDYELPEAEIVSPLPVPQNLARDDGWEPDPEPLPEPDRDEYDDEPLLAEDFVPEDYMDERRGFGSRIGGMLLSKRSLAIAAVLVVAVLVGGGAFLGLGGYSYMKKVYWQMNRDAMIVVPEASSSVAADRSNKSTKPVVKRPPDWGPTLYAPIPNERAQGGSNG